MNISLEEYRKLSDRISELARENEELRETISVASPKWFSVKDRMPDDEGYYLVRVYDGSIEHCTFEVYGWYKGTFIYWAGGMELPVGINTHGENIPMKVTHWIPLPEPPEE